MCRVKFRLEYHKHLLGIESLNPCVAFDVELFQPRGEGSILQASAFELRRRTFRHRFSEDQDKL